MGDGSLSQDEIDQLLKGTDDVLPSFGAEPSPAPASFSASQSSFSPVQRDQLTDLLNSVVSGLGPSLSGYLQKDLMIGNATVEVKDASLVQSELSGQAVQVQMGFNGSVSGQNLIVMGFKDAGAIASLMFGEDGTPPADLTEAHQSTLQEFFSSLLSAMATQIGQRSGSQIGTSPPDLSMVTAGNQLRLPAGDVVKVTYSISIGGVLSSKFTHVLDINLASGLVRSGSQSRMGASQGGSHQFMQQQMMPQQSVDISPVKFPPLSGSGIPENIQKIDLLMDVQLTLTVELGRTKQLVKDVLGLGEGSIIELDKLAGEPVDLLVNNKLIAKGEVVVIDENFGVRVTDIVSPSERMTKMGSGM